MKSHIMSVGKTEELILKELALNPGQLIKPLSKAIKKDYSSVHKAVKNLLRKDYLITTYTESEKGVPYEGYKLNERGLAYVLATNNVNFNRMLENYEADVKYVQAYRKLDKLILNPKVMRKILKGAGRYHLTIGSLTEKPPKADSIFFLATATALLMQGLTPNEKEYLRKAVKRDRKLNRDFQRIIKDLGL